MKIYLVRHAGVTVRPEVPSEHWHLSPEGRAAADALAEEPIWQQVRAIRTSAEPKAAATAQRIAARHGLPVRFEPALREVERPWMEDGYADAARRYLGGEALVGWEPRDATLARVQRSIDGIVARHKEHNIAVVSHGLALTLYLSAALGLDSEESFAPWSQMCFPDVAVLDVETRRLERSFGAA